MAELMVALRAEMKVDEMAALKDDERVDKRVDKRADEMAAW